MMELGNMIFGHSRGHFEVDRGWVEIFITLLDALNMDVHITAFENDIFSVFPYYWDDAECDNDEVQRECPCMDGCPILKPNFLYKPTGFEINWYKYPFRDSFMNQEISRKQFIDIIIACCNSVK